MGLYGKLVVKMRPLSAAIDTTARRYAEFSTVLVETKRLTLRSEQTNGQQAVFNSEKKY